jgi:hypothetical protein
MSSGLPLYQQFINFLYSSGAIEVKKDFHEQCNQINKMIANDVSGVVSTVTDYSINSASEAKFKIECSDNTTEELLNLWLQEININIDGIPTGLQELAKEYYKERWAGSSLCLMKIGVWKKISIGTNSITVPTVMWFVNGASVYVKRVNPDSFKLGTDTFYFDDAFEKEIKNSKEDILVNKPFSRCFEQYPSPYLVKKGVLQNWLAVEKLSSKSNQVIQKFIPYLFELEKGDKDAFLKELSDCDDPAVLEAVTNFKTAMERYENEGAKTPIAAHTFDQKFTHLIPDLTKILNEELYKQSYRALLAGLGFMTVVQGVGDTRKEETITPKPFIAEVNAGVTDFKAMLMDVVRLIIDKNKIDHRKLFSENKELQITNSPIKINVQNLIDAYRSAFVYGAIGYTTYQEVLDINPEQELERAIKERKEGLRDIYYPHMIQNNEKDTDTNVSPVPTTKKQVEKTEEKTKKPVQKAEVINEPIDPNLETAPFKDVQDLLTRHPNLKKYPEDAQMVFLEVFNSIYNETKDDARAFSGAYSKMNKFLQRHYIKNPDGTYTKKGE